MAKISGDDIFDGSIDNSKIKVDAGVETSKLADGNKFIRKDDGQYMTKDQIKDEMNTIVDALMLLIKVKVSISSFYIDEPMIMAIPNEFDSWQFTQVPLAGKYIVYKGGAKQTEGAGKDYTRNGSVVTFNQGEAPVAEQSVTATFIRE